LNYEEIIIIYTANSDIIIKCEGIYDYKINYLHILPDERVNNVLRISDGHHQKTCQHILLKQLSHLYLLYCSYVVILVKMHHIGNNIY